MVEVQEKLEDQKSKGNGSDDGELLQQLIFDHQTGDDHSETEDGREEQVSKTELKT